MDDSSTPGQVPPAAYRIGQLVALKSRSESTGAITAVLSGIPEIRYAVLLDGAIKTYYESQLQPIFPTPTLETVSLAEFDAYLSALHIQHPSTSIIYSLNTARIECVPYQFRPVLKFIRADRPRLLIADGVGVGKTIEAGLILKELQARTDLHRVLVICPKPLITERKWESEMKRFDERFLPLDGEKIRYCITETDLDGVWPEQYAKSILPYSLLDEELLFGSRPGTNRGRKGLLDLSPFPRFDLVIVDEAQHIRNPETYAHRCVRIFCENADAAIFLTATPLEMGSNDLFVLLNLLRPDLVRDLHTFEVMTKPNPAINNAINITRSGRSDWQVSARHQLEEAVRTSWGELTIRHDPSFSAVMEALVKPELSHAERVKCISMIEGLHTLSEMINRTRRRDIGDFTVRRPHTVTVEFTEPQRKLHDDIIATQALILTVLHPSANIKFLLTMIRRQSASCLYGLVPLLKSILTRHVEELSAVESDTEFDNTARIDAVIETKIAEVLQQAENLDDYDPKLEALKAIVREKLSLPNPRLMIFSSFRHTLRYLHDSLSTENLRLGLVHGDIPDDQRVSIRNRFRMESDRPDAIDVLMFSEVGSEGLDYQFCDCLVNYDLPWNPMRIEQRIGRIDRRGQTSEKIKIVNIITPGTVDADIYERCLLRIGIFDREIGASDEILGEITKQLQSIAEDFTLTDHERREKLQQLADNQLRLIREQQELEDREAELFALRVPFSQAQKEFEDASSRWLSPALLENLVRLYLGAITGGEQGGVLGDKAVKTLRTNQDARNLLVSDYMKLGRSNSALYRDWETWLRGNNPHLRITFDQAAATENAESVLLSPVHPLVRQAAAFCARRSRAAAACQVRSDHVSSGDHPFAVYQWRYIGLQEDMRLQPITLNADLAVWFGRLLSSAAPLDLTENELPTGPVLQELERKHYVLWSTALEKHRGESDKRIAFRLASLESSYTARISLIKDQLARASDERIRKMYHAQIERVMADHVRRVEEVNRARDAVDLQAELVAIGIIRVNTEQGNGEQLREDLQG